MLCRRGTFRGCSPLHTGALRKIGTDCGELTCGSVRHVQEYVVGPLSPLYSARQTTLDEAEIRPNYTVSYVAQKWG